MIKDVLISHISFVSGNRYCRLENLGQKISDLIELNRNINSTVVSSNNSTDKLIVAYMEARDELDHMKLKLEESFQENGLFFSFKTICLSISLFKRVLLTS